ESELRLFLRDAGFTELSPQVDVLELGYRVDLADPGHKIAIEYEGSYHEDPAQLTRDRIRRNRLQAAGWTVIEVDRRTAWAQREAMWVQLRAAYRLGGVACCARRARRHGMRCLSGPHSQRTPAGVVQTRSVTRRSGRGLLRRVARTRRSPGRGG